MASHLRIKICGITSEADAQLATDLGADAIGLNFYPPSPRYIDVERAAAIVRRLPPFVEAVGLFCEQPLCEIYPIVERLGRVRTIQWHGENHEIRNPFPYRFIAAFHLRADAGLADIERYLGACRAAGYAPDAVLVDAHVPGQFGGTGRTAPWQLIAGFRPGVPVILAGGLTCDNVAEAVRIVRPYGVDVASGVEESPGIKNAEKLRRFIREARAAADV
jgi:phosphoribosylanthranilate isomerase